MMPSRSIMSTSLPAREKPIGSAAAACWSSLAALHDEARGLVEQLVAVGDLGRLGRLLGLADVLVVGGRPCLRRNEVSRAISCSVT
jgi:hypothetical protein